MLSTFHATLASIEEEVERGTINTQEACLKRLREIGLSSFGELMFTLPIPVYPQISRLLPSMASTETQRLWTGSDGINLLRQSLDFVTIASSSYSECTGRTLRNAKIMDFGSGYGRLARLFYFFTSPNNLYMLDSYTKSLDECTKHGLTHNLFLSDPMPQSLPVGSMRFDFIYSFSVFTHLNEQAARQCLTTLSNYLDPGGVIVITIRPYEFWAQETHVSGILRTLEIDPYSLVARHQSGEFVFVPSGGIGQSTYGDSSFKAEWISKNLPQLKIVFLDYSLNDPSQLYVGLMKH